MTSQQEVIAAGRSVLGIEFGSTRIKAALIGPDSELLATGSHDWENQFSERLWTYPLEAVWDGLRDCYAKLAQDVQRRYGVRLIRVGAIGISAMMHGYLAFDAAGQLLVPFRTWRNTNTAQAAEELSELFGYNIPLRWSIAHLYQAMIDQEPHVPQLAYLTTLAGYVHWQLTGEKVIGVGDASGMFPIDTEAGDFNHRMIGQFDELAAARGLAWRASAVLPEVRVAGESAGFLTEAGAELIDPSGTLLPGIPLCPPEGDAGTGMVATNSVAQRTGNVSAGTSIFAMIVLERELSKVYPEIDLVTTPSGELVAMVHCNNGASELNEWCGVFAEFANALGVEADTGVIFETLFRKALEGEPDAGGLLAYNYLAGEPITGLAEGRPMFWRTPDSHFSLANFMRAQLFASFGTLRLGMDILAPEGVKLDSMFAHGGVFKTKAVAQRFLAAALKAPVSVGDIAGEGGAWGIALLASYLVNGGSRPLGQYLSEEVFASAELDTCVPSPEDLAGFDSFMERFSAGLAVQRAAIQIG
ncbi:MAG: FGGY-family carbohydrate kinase [Propionibacteriaceae bacterium]|nr:FGGY-family carbohydrate kinase [Propionibacteriaceae bacterium]